MKKKYLIVFLLNLLFEFSHAQYGNISKEELASLKTHKTYFVLDADTASAYNIEIKRTAEKYWKLNSYEFVSFSKFEELKSDPQKGFVIKVHNGVSYSYLSQGKSPVDQNSGTSHYAGPASDGLVLTMGGVSYFRYPNTSIIHLPLRNWGLWVFVEDVSQTSINYMLGSYLQTMQDCAKTIETSEKNSLGIKSEKSIYNKNKAALNSKTLLLNIDDAKGEYNWADDGAIKALYPKAYKFVLSYKIKEAVETQDENVLILHFVNTSGWFHYFVTEAKGGKVVYANWFTPSIMSKNVTHMLKDLAK